MMKLHQDWLVRRSGVSSTMALAILFWLAAVTQPACAQTYTVLYTFTGTGGDATGPAGELIRDSAGNLYGTSGYGGAYDFGTVFKVETNGIETVLYSFSGGVDGASPNAGLIRDSAGDLYGTANQGGAYKTGAVFKLDAVGTETVLHSFGSENDGQYPRAGLIRDAAGNFYGTASSGGAFSQGIVFELDATAAETVLYDFPGGTGGWGPLGSLNRDAAGNLYGTTLGGGDDVDCDCGIAFKLDTTGTETVLQNFTGSNGARLGFGMTRDNAGNLYGTTVYGGLVVSGLCSSGCGTVFKLDATGAESVLHTFTGKVDGRYPVGILIRDAAGNLYGTTQLGGAFNFGTVFKIGLTGRETVLHSFTGGADGGNPGAGVIEDAAGNLYGVAENGGANGYGTVFKLAP